MQMAMVRIVLLGMTLAVSAAPVAGQIGPGGRDQWCGSEPTQPNERPELQNPEALQSFADQLAQLVQTGVNLQNPLYWRSEAGDVRRLNKVVEIDIWFCVDPAGSVTGVRVPQLGRGVETAVLKASQSLRFAPSGRSGSAKARVATLTMLLDLGRKSGA